MKIHASVEAAGRPVRLVLMAGQRGDNLQAAGLLTGYRRQQIGCVIADAGYDADATRTRARRMRARRCIKPNPTRKAKKRYDKARS